MAKRVWPWLALVLGAILLVVILEAGNRDSASMSFMDWLNKAPVSVLLANFLLAGLFLSFLMGLIGRLWTGLTIGLCLGTLLAVANATKLQMLEEPVFPWELALAWQAFNLGSVLLSLKHVAALVGGPALLLLVYVLDRRFGPPRLAVLRRVMICVLSGVAVLSFALAAPSAAKRTLASVGIRNNFWAQNTNFAENGFALAFALNINPPGTERPPGYSREAVLNALESGHASPSEGAASAGNPKPHVIFILSEAFWDPSRLPGAQIEPELLSNMHALHRETQERWLLSCTRAGRTANVEFEMLTGFTTASMEAGVIPYVSLIHRPTPALPWVFAAHGYKTVAVHPNAGQFWRRSYVYPLLGFQEFRAIEAFEGAERRGHFVSDAAVLDHVAKLVEEASEPQFIFGITIQNHGPYEPGRYSDQSVQVQGMPKERFNKMLATYAQGVYEADQTLGSFVERLRKLKTPVVLVYFGDHLPMLPSIYGTLKFTSPALVKTPLLWETPTVVWANFRIEPPANSRLVSSNLFAPEILGYAGISHPFYGSFLQQLRQAYPAFNHALSIDGQGAMDEGESRLKSAIMRDYSLIQYDMLAGKQHAKARYFPEVGAAPVRSGAAADTRVLAK